MTAIALLDGSIGQALVKRVGGCCEVGPDHIAELARRLRAAGHELVQESV